MLDIAAACLVITALLSYVNQRFVGLPTAIGVMAIALMLSLLLVALNAFGWAPQWHEFEAALVHSIDFSGVLMQGMLSLLLFAGALHVDLPALRRLRWQVAVLAGIGTLLSTIAVGLALWWLLPWVGLPLPLPECLLFGALISPTDPIAVMGILRQVGAPKDLELVITGESLFNDGVGVVLFSLLLGVIATGIVPAPTEAASLLAREAGGGLLFGVILGWTTYRLLASIDHYQVEVMLTLAAVMGGYALAQRLHVSGPLAMVVAGLMVGHYGRAHAMSDTTRRHVDVFWELIDEILNAVLFVLIGLEVVMLHYDGALLAASGVALVVTLTARWLTAGLPVSLLHARFRLPAGSAGILTWGGLRGGISVALVLSLPSGPVRDALLGMTYVVVVFSILCQGLTIGRLVQRAVRPR
jgi:CPA1 family monovalent cation:H+ antiporter